jgi:putative N6-adenine-specific DNA methylase
MHLKGYDEEVYLQEMERLDKKIKEVKGLQIIATDISTQAIANAKKNAIAAGVADMIQFEVCDFAATKVPQDAAGIMMINPEYGERLGELEELEETYSRIGDFMKQQHGAC